MNPGLVVKLRPSGPWRIGPDSGARNRVDVIYHSDSLYSAVTSALSRLGLLEEWLDATARSGVSAVSFSSCFPFLDDIGFVVPPRTVWPPASRGLMSARVRWKSARFVPLGIVQAVLSGQKLDENQWTVDGPSECLVPAGKPGPFRTGVRWNAAVDRLTGSSERHSTACLEFRPGAGLWTVVSFADEAAQARWQEPVKAAFRLLADTGFGGERSRGWGRSEAPEFIEGVLPDMILAPVTHVAPAPVEPEPDPDPEPVAEAAVRAPSEILPFAAEKDPEPETPVNEPPVEAPPVEEPPPSEPVPAPNPDESPVEASAPVEPEIVAAAPSEPEAVASEPVPEAPVATEPEIVAAAPSEPEAVASEASEPEIVVAAPSEPEAVVSESAPEAPVAPETSEPEIVASESVPEASEPEIVASSSGEPSPLQEPPPDAPIPEPPPAEPPVEEPPVQEPPATEPPPAPEPEQPQLAAAPKPPAAPSIPGAHPYWSLSLYTPAADDSVDWNRGSYSLVARAGRVDSPAGSGELKKLVQMVAEGSVVYAADSPHGAAPNVAPDGFAHPVFRAGFVVAIRLPEVS